MSNKRNKETHRYSETDMRNDKFRSSTDRVSRHSVAVAAATDEHGLASAGAFAGARRRALVPPPQAPGTPDPRTSGWFIKILMHTRARDYVDAYDRITDLDITHW
jgi:hypothetical protein